MALPAVDARGPIVPIMMRNRRGLAAIVAAAAAAGVDRNPTDLMSFARSGTNLLHGHLAAVYADQANQGGPVQLILNAALRLLAPNGSVWLPVAALTNAVLVYVAMRGCAALQRDVGTVTSGAAQGALREVLVAAIVVLWLMEGSLWSGHSAEALIAVLWCMAMISARDGRNARAGVLFGLGMGIAPWAILATPAVLAVTRLRAGVAVAAVAGIVGPALYAPFVLSGRFALLHYHWIVEPHSLVSLLLPVGTPFGWTLRLVQAALVIGGTAGAAVGLRRRPELSFVLAPMTATALRIASDPLRLDYYWLPIEVLTVLAVVVAPMTATGLGIQGRTLVLCYVAWVSVTAGQGEVGALLVVFLVIAHATPVQFSERSREFLQRLPRRELRLPAQQ